jgi:hypothetical protein
MLKFVMGECGRERKEREPSDSNKTKELTKLLKEEINETKAAFKAGELKYVFEDLKMNLKGAYKDAKAISMGNFSVLYGFADFIKAPYQDEFIGDGVTTDSQAVLPLIQQIDASGDMVEVILQHSEINYFPVVLMTGGGGRDFDFWSIAQYFTKQQPRRYAPPMVMGSIFDTFCSKELGDEMIDAYNFALTIPDQWYGGPECHETTPSLVEPPPGCENLFSRLSRSGIIYFEHLDVAENKNWNITGGWKFVAFSFTTQLQSALAGRWLPILAPEMAATPDRFTANFPMYPLDTIMQVPTKYAYLLSNYMSHLSVVQQHCFIKNETRSFAPFCVSNPDLCPCGDISSEYTMSFVFPVMV